MKTLSKDAYLFDEAGYTQQKSLTVRADGDDIYIGSSRHKREDFEWELENHGLNTRLTSKLGRWFVLL